ncbi:MAG: hypothetical protein JST06_02880 [Bacteroidetes bacterium]|nr:hypothetical protein [Bacteroidota bacterium]MBS1629611.1 hypothetical protein [Bacteroidota bacterium]
MDIAKYIGLYLLKNNFCYIHGLGNLEIRRKAAEYDGESLRAPEYEVTLSPGGSIDDALANFIATHEQTSISKAANALRDFSIASRAELAAGKEVEIPGVGKFIEQNGLTRFVGSPQLQHTPPPVPIIRMAKRTEEQPVFHHDTTQEKPASEIAWGKIVMLALALLIILAGGIFAYRYFSSRPATPVVMQDTAIVQPAPEPPVATLPVDTSHVIDSTTTKPAAPSGDFQVVLNSYSSRPAAEKRKDALKRNGNNVELVSKDSSNFFVVLNMPRSTADTTRMLDSLRRFFNPKGVYILH